MLAEDIYLKSKNIRGLETAWLEHIPDDPVGIIVFLHGFPDDATSWSEQLNFFRQKSLILLAPYSRGISPSSPTKNLSRYGTQSQSLDLKKILAELQGSESLPLWFVGHDLGAVYAWNCCRFFQKNTKGLIILNGLNLRQMAARLKNPIQLTKSWYMFFMQIPKVPEFISQIFPEKVLRLAYYLGKAPSSSRVGEDISKSGLGGIPQYRAFLRELVQQVLRRTPRIKCQVLVLWGIHDRVLLPPTLDEIEKDAVKPTVRMLEAGHWLQREKPDEVNRLIDQFINGKESKT